jgi:cyanophycinase
MINKVNNFFMGDLICISTTPYLHYLFLIIKQNVINYLIKIPKTSDKQQMEYANNIPDALIPNGTLLIIGGAENKETDEALDQNMDVLQCFIKLISHEKPVIEVITSAGKVDIEGTIREYKEALLKLGAGEVNHIHHNVREEINFDELELRLNKAHGVFFAGGDQLKLTSIYGGTQFLLLLKQRYIHNHLVIAGTSAGAMALSTPMIFRGVGRDEMIAGNVKVTTGLEFMRDVCIDTHFVNRGRFVRMAQVIAENPASIGIGIEEDTAIIVRNGVDIEVVGGGVVIVINAHNSYGTNITNHTDAVPLTIRGLEVDILSAGQKYTKPQLNLVHQ